MLVRNLAQKVVSLRKPLKPFYMYTTIRFSMFCKMPSQEGSHAFSLRHPHQTQTVFWDVLTYGQSTQASPCCDFTRYYIKGRLIAWRLRIRYKLLPYPERQKQSYKKTTSLLLNQLPITNQSILEFTVYSLCLPKQRLPFILEVALWQKQRCPANRKSSQPRSRSWVPKRVVARAFQQPAQRLLLRPRC